ncbi:hypothetical protein Tco_0823239 [Tanacetum coccineum]|uniref:Uncharacterized protein n=1 Tax=Tanacetum coccineum TaxID=301880 RepID=A0ABQ5AHD0_9ASTR
MIHQQFCLTFLSKVSEESIGALDAKDALGYILDCTLKDLVMSADSAVTYTSVHSEARSWSIPSEDPYEEPPDSVGAGTTYDPADHVPSVHSEQSILRT